MPSSGDETWGVCARANVRASTVPRSCAPSVGGMVAGAADTLCPLEYIGVACFGCRVLGRNGIGEAWRVCKARSGARQGARQGSQQGSVQGARQGCRDRSDSVKAHCSTCAHWRSSQNVHVCVCVVDALALRQQHLYHLPMALSARRYQRRPTVLASPVNACALSHVRVFPIFLYSVSETVHCLIVYLACI